MDLFLTPFSGWHWLGLGIIMLGLEVVVPTGVFFLWWGLAALCVSLVHVMYPLSSASGLILFAVLSLLYMALGRIFYQKTTLSKGDIIERGSTHLNQRVQQLIGKRIQLQEAIEHGRGVLRLNDTRWNIHGPDAPSGTWVEITGCEGVVLKVKIVKDSGHH